MDILFTPDLIHTEPAYIAAIAANAGKQLTANIESAFGTFTNQSGSRLSSLGYSGAAYDSVRGRVMHMGEGHQDGNGNAVYGLTLWDTETPAWTRFKDYSTPPSSTPQNPGAEAHDTLNGNTATGAGDPPGFHSYCNLVYDGYNDRLVLFGLPTYFSTNGSSSARIRSLSSLGSSPPLWDAFTARPAKNNQGQGSSSVFDSSSNTIWSKECGSNVGIQRYDCAANTMSTVTDGLGTWSLDQAVACKPGSYIVCIGGFAGLPLDAGGGDMVLFDLTSYGGGSITSYTRTVSVPAALKVAKVGMAYHPPSGWFVAWIGGNTIHILKPPADPFTGTWTFETRTPGGDALPSISSSSLGGVYSKFQWCPSPSNASVGVFCMTALAGTDGAYTVLDTYLYKPNF